MCTANKHTVRLNNETNRSACNYDERNLISGDYWQKYQGYIISGISRLFLFDGLFSRNFTRSVLPTNLH